MTVNQRIKIILVSYNIDEKKIHSEIGMSSKMVKKYIDGESLPNYNFISWLFKKVPNLNPKWLSKCLEENGAMDVRMERLKCSD